MQRSKPTPRLRPRPRHSAGRPTAPRSSVLTLAFGFLLLAGLAACSGPGDPGPQGPGADAPERVHDPHSFARPDLARVTHLSLDLTVDFDARRLVGRASLDVAAAEGTDELILDTRGLDVRDVFLEEGEGAEGDEQVATFALTSPDPLLGRALVIDITPETRKVHVDYATGPGSDALQWLEPAQTSGEYPFLFTQSQAILARTWVPCQDTPAVRFTYDATVRVPPALLALMSAENPQELSTDGVYHFTMPQAIPSYLLALAVGELEFRPLSERVGVYAEPPVVEAAAWEFAETEAMMEVAEALYGPYRWGRYDILVLPPSFPFGGMENPRLTFATPTILAGDRSLTSLVAHELAHSWSGNLVTNATWNDFWLNEGFTTYFEQRIMEGIYGREYSETLAALGLQDLETTLQDLPPRDTWLHLELEGRDPDAGMTDVAYEKGRFFLRRLEEAVGRERWDAFLAAYFERHAFESMTSEAFLEELRAELEDGSEPVDPQAWIYGPGLPVDPDLEPVALVPVDRQLAALVEGAAPAELVTEGWNTHQWLHFLRHLPGEVDAEAMARLDEEYAFSTSGNSEILHAWLLESIRRGYGGADDALEDFLTRQGRRKFLRPLYTALAETPEGRERALEIYRQARSAYHPISRATVDEILDWPGEGATPP